MGFIIWMTGLPCSGKTTITRKLKELIPNLAYWTEMNYEKGFHQRTLREKEKTNTIEKLLIWLSCF